MDVENFEEYLLFLGNQLKTTRLSLKKNQKDWAIYLEKTQGNVSRMENTGMGITMDVVLKLCNIQNLDMNWFFKGVGESGLENSEIGHIDEKKIDNNLLKVNNSFSDEMVATFHKMLTRQGEIFEELEDRMERIEKGLKKD